MEGARQIVIVTTPTWDATTGTLRRFEKRAGADAWTILKAVGGAAGSALVSPRVFATIGALVLVGALALYGLQRLFDSEEESSR